MPDHCSTGDLKCRGARRTYAPHGDGETPTVRGEEDLRAPRGPRPRSLPFSSAAPLTRSPRLSSGAAEALWAPAPLSPARWNSSSGCGPLPSPPAGTFHSGAVQALSREVRRHAPAQSQLLRRPGACGDSNPGKSLRLRRAGARSPATGGGPRVGSPSFDPPHWLRNGAVASPTADWAA